MLMRARPMSAAVDRGSTGIPSFIMVVTIEVIEVRDLW
jgi:hypothetical protein